MQAVWRPAVGILGLDPRGLGFRVSGHFRETSFKKGLGATVHKKHMCSSSPATATAHPGHRCQQQWRSEHVPTARVSQRVVIDRKNTRA